MGLWADLGCEQRRTNAAHRIVAAVVATTPGSRIGALVIPRLDAAASHLSRGATTATDAMTGLPTFILVTTGARSGATRHSYLVPMPHHGDIAVIGSNFGGARTPGWVYNLRANPAVRVVHGHRELPAVARELVGEDHEEVWATAKRMYAGYGLYRERASHRTISVWLLQGVNP